jgi:NAD-dependent SIR2 family protein deacetylase
MRLSDSAHRKVIVYSKMSRFITPNSIENLQSIQGQLFFAIREKNLAQMQTLVQEMGIMLRKYAVPMSIINEYTDYIFSVIQSYLARHLIPPSIYNDLRFLISESFLGGLSHSLKTKPEEKIKAVNIEEELKKIENIKITKEQPIVFFLGAGASKPNPSNIPTVSEMLEELWKKSNQMENKPLSKLEEWCRENKIDNIEEMLTGVTFSDFMIKNRKVHNLLNSVLYPEWGSLKDISIRDVDAVSSFQSMIDTFFSLLVGTMLNAQPNALHEAIANFTKLFGCTSIITTNYDVCMDQALDDSKIGYSYVIGAKKQESTPLIKMHGSINWFYCQTCQNVLMPTVAHMHQSITNDVPYSVTGMCPVCSASTKQFIVPPTTYKFLIYPPIVQVWNAGREIFEQSKFFVIIGYSFSLGDDYITKMLLRAIREDPQKQLIIIDKSEETIEKFRKYVKRHAVNFEEKNFHAIVGSAEKIGPEVINMLIKKNSSENA